MALGVCTGICCMLLRVCFAIFTIILVIVIIILHNYTPDTKFPFYTQTQTPDDGMRTEIGQFIRMKTNTFRGSIIAINESRIRFPGFR